MTVPGTKTGRERAGSEPDSGGGRVTRAVSAIARRGALPRAGGFWLVAGVFVLLFCAAAAPSPLYGVYQAQWRFSAITLTAVFAIYALVLLLTLLVFGSVSDYLGRRRVILAALMVTAGACGVPGPPWGWARARSEPARWPPPGSWRCPSRGPGAPAPGAVRCVTDGRGGAAVSYPFTEPERIPRMNCRWNTKVSTMTGSETRIAAADSRLICTR
jgi:hypothetical protein